MTSALRSCLVTLAAGLFLPLPCQADAPGSWAVLAPGPWTQADCGASQCDDPSTLHWLALARTAQGWALAPVHPAWNQERDELASSVANTLALLHDASLRPGPVATPAPARNQAALRFTTASDALRIAFQGRDWDIAVTGGNTVVRAGKRHTVIGRADPGPAGQVNDPYTTRIVWAGDLDRDGLLDFLVEEENGGTDQQLCLYLSAGPRAASELLAKVGCEVWGG